MSAIKSNLDKIAAPAAATVPQMAHTPDIMKVISGFGMAHAAMKVKPAAPYDRTVTAYRKFVMRNFQSVFDPHTLTVGLIIAISNGRTPDFTDTGRSFSL
jgi:hypothetical protein